MRDRAAGAKLERVTEGSSVPPSPAAVRAFIRLRSRLARKFRSVELPVTLPWSGATYHVLQPASFDRLLTAAARDPEQNMPYWATIWPSGVALGDAALLRSEWFRGRRVLELGGGLGITATALLAAGADPVVTDYAPETLLLARANGLRNTGREPCTLQLNWRQPRPALFAWAPYEFVLAADVLYEARDVEPLLALVDRLVAPGGLLWLAEPGRAPAQRFVAAAQAQGWHEECTHHAGPWSDPKDAGVVVNLHLMRRGANGDMASRRGQAERSDNEVEAQPNDRCYLAGLGGHTHHKASTFEDRRERIADAS